MTDQHPITPPPELVQQWIAQVWHEGTPVRVAASDLHVATEAAQWGADQELEACCEWLITNNNPRWSIALREGRRSKPPSLAEEVLTELDSIATAIRAGFGGDLVCDAIRRALERLQQLEAQQ